MDTAPLRARFPAARNWTYLNAGSRGIISDAARTAAVAMVDGHWQEDVGKAVLAPLLTSVRARFAQLIGGTADEAAITKNVSEGINAIATAIDWQHDDAIVLCSDLEHPNNVYIWHGLAQRHGLRIIDVPARANAIDAPAMAAAIDARTRLVTTSTVTFTPGFRTDLAPIGHAARAHGALFMVDAVQSCGVLHIDVGNTPIDALVTSTSKGLLGMMGLGFLWVRADWIPRLAPAYVARNSIATAGHYSEMETTAFAYAPNAERFEIGNYNYPGIAAADAALAELLAIGTPAIEAHATALAAQLRNGLEHLGYRVQRPTDPAAATHLVTIGERGAGGAYATNDPRLNALIDALTAGRVRFSVRRGLVRFGFHLYNDASDVARVLAIARTIPISAVAA